MIKNDEFLIEPDPRRRAWVEVDPLVIEANTKIMKELLLENCLLMAVVKADGYGHGANTVAKASLKGGASYLGVATLEEGIELREEGFKCPILVLGNLVNAFDLNTCIHWDLIPTISSYKVALICQKIAKEGSRKFSIHIKVDTGMTRLGCDFSEAKELISLIQKLSNLELKGIYSHLALADNDKDINLNYFNNQQLTKFNTLLRDLDFKKSEILFHLANSAGTISDQKLHFDMVRIGLALYGYSPFLEEDENLGLKPALSLKAKVTLIRDVPKGVGVSYGHIFTTNRRSRLAVVSVGYADGVPRILSGKISALFKGQLLPQVGSITMDQLIVDATDCPEVEVGSVLTFLGSDGDFSITTHQWSKLSGLIPWEILCGFKHRLPRVIV